MSIADNNRQGSRSQVSRSQRGRVPAGSSLRAGSSGRPKVLDLFSGAGGLGLGFEQAGFDVVAAVELDPVHAGVHAHNFPECVTLCANASQVTGAHIAEVTGGQIDVVIGGAPCQGFSMIGKRVLDDERNLLVREFLRLVVETQPSVFVLENVKGLTIGKHRAFLDELVAEFDKVGYRVALPWRVLDAQDFGVPQGRQRLFLMGVKNGVPLPPYPEPFDTDKRVNCAEALGDLPDAESFQSLLLGDSVRTKRVGKLSSYAREMRCMERASWHFGYRRAWDPGLLTASARTAHTSISRNRFSETQEGSVEPISRFFKLSGAGICNTLRAGTDSSRGAFTSPRPIHYKYDRCITVREMARLHGFPDWFRFHPTKWHGARQIGNAVPPPLARIVASQVLRYCFEIKPRRPSRTLHPSGGDLFAMGMKGASEYWNVEVPIGKRDRKSGATKRKQVDIERERLAR